MLSLFFARSIRLFVMQAITCNTRTSTTSSGAYTVSGCAFQSLSCAGSGCAIYISNSASTFSVSKTIFSACTSAALGGYPGGAFYFVGTSTSISEVCGMDCAVISNGQFFYNSASSSTVISSLSLLRCSNSSLTGTYQAFWADSGVINATQINSSFNTLQYDGCACIFYEPSQLTVSFQASYNCTSENGIIIHYFRNIPNGFVTKSIVSSNTQSKTTYGIVCHIGDSSGYSLTYEDCYFVNNMGGPLFDGRTYGSIEVIDCYICGSDNSLSIGNVGTSACVLATSNAAKFAVESLQAGSLHCSVPTYRMSASFTSIGTISRTASFLLFMVII